jgi:hypothetical protein
MHNFVLKMGGETGANRALYDVSSSHQHEPIFQPSGRNPAAASFSRRSTQSKEEEEIEVEDDEQQLMVIICRFPTRNSFLLFHFFHVSDGDRFLHYTKTMI